MNVFLLYLLVFALYIIIVFATIAFVTLYHMSNLSDNLEHLLQTEDELIETAFEQITTSEKILIILPIVNILYLVFLFFILSPLIKDRIDKRY